MSFWEEIKKDLQKGLHEGIAAVKEGAVYVREKAEELTEEGKRQYRLFELKSKVQREFTELGGKVYDASGKMKNPLVNPKIKAVLGRIKKLEAEVAKVQGKPGAKTKKTVLKKSSARKKA